MVTNTRSFLRDFTSFKAKARKGEIVRVRERGDEYTFVISSSRKSLLGAAKDKIVFNDDLTGPTLANKSWKPSL